MWKVTVYRKQNSKAKLRLDRGDITSEALVVHFLQNIEKFNPQYNAFLAIQPKENLIKLAKLSDHNRKRNQVRGLLEGIPLAIKDNITTNDLDTTCASNMLEGYRPPMNASCVERLKSQGAIILGKTNMDEFAMGWATTTGNRGKSINPWKGIPSTSLLSSSTSLNSDRVAGGSSGGSAVAVASDMALGGIGSDTGGSCRVPASYCGIIGFKPSYGAISRYGLISYASSLDTIGFLTRSVKDCSLLLDCLAGEDSRDSTSFTYNTTTTTTTTHNHVHSSWKGVRIGVLKEWEECKEIDEEVRNCWENSLKKLEKEGANIISISIPALKHSLACYYILASSECSSNMAKYDGLRYGVRGHEKDLESLYQNSRQRGFGEELKLRILLGTMMLSRHYYLQAQRVRRKIVQDFETLFQTQVDYFLGPTTPTPAPYFKDISCLTKVEEYANDIMTVPSSLAGLPSIALPVTLHSTQAMPISLQLIAGFGRDKQLLQSAHHFHGLVLENKQFPLPRINL